MRKPYIYLVAISAFLVSCNSNTATQETPAATAIPAATAPVTSKLSDSATQQLTHLLADYYSLKDALITGNAEKSNTAAGVLNAGVDDFTKVIKDDSSIKTAVAPYIDTIKTVTNGIISARSNKIEEIRTRFSKISGPMFALCKKVELKNAGVYFAHCPMALNDTGANWLSNYSEIKNPYFGDKMLDCGDVEDSLK